MSEAWSMADFVAALQGAGGRTIDLSSDGLAGTGCTVAFAEDQGSMVIGAKGDGMYNQRLNRSGTATFRYLKTAAVNSELSDLWKFENASSANVGKNTITIRNVQTGDLFVCTQCGIRKFPDNTNAIEGGENEWVFNVIRIDPSLGDGNPALLANGGI